MRTLFLCLFLAAVNTAFAAPQTTLHSEMVKDNAGTDDVRSIDTTVAITATTETTISVSVSWTTALVSGSDYWSPWVRLYTPDAGGSYVQPASNGATMVVDKNKQWFIRNIGTHLSTQTFSETAAHALNEPLPPEWYADFALAANTTRHTIYYRFYQGETMVTEYAHTSGTAGVTVHLSGLDEPPPTIVAFASTGGWVINSSGVPVWTDHQFQEPVGGGDPVSDAEPPEPYLLLTPTIVDPPVTQPPVPAPTPPAPTTPTPAPTPSPAPPPHVPFGVPYPTPSGSGGATAADIQAAANVTAGAADAAAATAVASAAAVTGAIDNASTKSTAALNNVAGAVDKVAANNAAGQAATLQAAANQTNATMAGFASLNSQLGAVKSEVTRAADTLQALKDQQTGPTSIEATDMANQMLTAAQAKGAQAEALVNARAIPAITVESPVVSPEESFWVKEILGRTVNFNPVARFPYFFASIKAILTWAIAMGFVWWIWTYLPQLKQEIATAAPLKFNVQAITGAVPYVGAVIGAVLTTAAVTFITPQKRRSQKTQACY